MKLYEIKENKYIVKCTNCEWLAKLQFNKDIFSLKGECNNGHSFSDIYFNKFVKEFVVKSQTFKSYDSLINVKCYNCDSKINYDFLIIL